MTKLGTVDLSSTSAEKVFFGDLAMQKLNFSLHLSIDLNFRHNSKKIEGGHLKRFCRKKMFSPKSMSNLGRLTVCGVVEDSNMLTAQLRVGDGSVLRNTGKCCKWIYLG